MTWSASAPRREITDDQVGHVELLRMSLGDMKWWLGGGAAVVSAALQAVALGLGSVVLLQALQVTALLSALPVYAWLTKQVLTRRQWVWAELLAGAVAVFVTVGDPAAGYQRASAAAVVVVIVATTALARGEAACMTAGDERRVTTGHIPVPAPEVRSPVVALAAGQA